MTGCVHRIDLNYTPQLNLIETPINNHSATCSVDVIDNRKSKHIVGYEKNAQGNVVGRVEIKNDLAPFIQDIISSELKNAGFNVLEDSGTQIEIEITRLHIETPGFPNAELSFDVNVIRRDGLIVYSKSIRGYGENGSFWAQQKTKYQAALSDALKEAINKLLRDKAFLQAIFKANLYEKRNAILKPKIDD